MERRPTGNPEPMNSHTNPGRDGMAGRVRAGDVQEGDRVIWGGRAVTLVTVTRRSGSIVHVVDNLGRDADLGVLTVLKLATEPQPCAVA